jgi:hypothetical protein
VGSISGLQERLEPDPAAQAEVIGAPWLPLIQGGAMLTTRLSSPTQSGIVCLLAVAFCFPAFAQTQHASARTTAPKYDLKTEKKIKGIVQEIKQVGEGHSALMHLVLKNGDATTVEVYLCPQHFLKDMDIQLKPGDEVEVTGSPTIENGVSIILAREIVKGTDTYVLRDDKGVPVWNWQHT